MNDTRAALRYAKAILNLAKESTSETSVNEDMLLILQTISENNALFGKKINNISLGLFQLLEENKRIGLLKAIAKKYAIIYDFDKHILEAKVTTAVPITETLEKQVLKKIVDLTGDKANLVNEVDPEILGGFILRVGDVQYDASIANHLNQLRKEFDNQDYISKL